MPAIVYERFILSLRKGRTAGSAPWNVSTTIWPLESNKSTLKLNLLTIESLARVNGPSAFGNPKIDPTLGGTISENLIKPFPDGN
jgi:hypothetical protein